MNMQDNQEDENSEKSGPDWDSFEVYEPEDEKKSLPKWLDRTIAVFFVTLILSIAFAVGGVIFTFLFYSRVARMSRRSSEMMLDQEARDFYMHFGIGGVIAVLLVVGIYFGKVHFDAGSMRWWIGTRRD